MATSTISSLITNHVTLGSAQYSANLTITNTGSVETSSGIDAIYGGASLANFTVTNQGFISNANNGIFANGPGTLINSGTIGNGNDAFRDDANAYVENSGLLSGTIDAVDLNGTIGFVDNQATGTITGQTGVFAVVGTVINNGIIQGSNVGIELLGGGTIIEAGTVSGSQDAIDTGAGAFTLDVDSGAVFVGGVNDSGNSGRINLAGPTAGSLNLGGSFTGFSQISFGSAAWTLEGTSAELTTKATMTGRPVPSITGFAVGDQIELSDFTATSGHYIAGTGLVLSNATASETIALIAPGENFYLNNGTITALISTISTSIATNVTLGNGTYATSLTIANTGTVSPAASTAIYGGPSLANASITNQGAIIGATSGIQLAAGGTILNSGSISGRYGIFAQGTLIATNSSGGVISGTVDGALLQSSGSILNSGSISGRYGIIISGSNVIHAAGTLIAINSSGGVISGTYGGVYLASGGTILNSGTISGRVLFAIYNKADNFTLGVYAGAAFNGNVVDGAGTGLLALDGATAGSLNLNGTFTGFSNISFGSAPWTLAGTSAELADGQTISGFVFGDELDISDLSITSPTTLNANSGGTLAITDAAATGGMLDLTFTGIGATQPFYLTSDGHGGTDIVLCYLAGTNILTPSGEKPIESLTIGDDIITRFGGIQKIKWLGRQSYAPRFLANNPEKWPVHITPGALDGTLPHRDLFISPGHSMLIGDKLILAKNLINGLTIRQDQPNQTIEYTQIELETHDCIQAEGAWSETFADAPFLRTQFHNHAEFWALYPDYQTPDQLTLCAPRPEHGPALAAALRPLLPTHTPGPLRGCIDQITTQGIEGWAQDIANPHLPILLEIRLSGRRYASILACDFRADLAPSGIGTGHHAFFFREAVPEPYLPYLTIHRATDGAQLHPAKHHQKAA